MSTTPEDTNLPDEPQPSEDPDATSTGDTTPDEQSSGDAGGSSLDESERPLIIP